MEENSYESTNINQKWLENVYENIKKLEEFEELARDGCSSLIEYIQVPNEQKDIVLAQVQYKNLTKIVTQIILLIKDLTPILKKEELEEFKKRLLVVRNVKDKKHLFIDTKYSSVKNMIVSAYMTEFFDKTIDYLHELQTDILKSIGHILFVKSSEREMTATMW